MVSLKYQFTPLDGYGFALIRHCRRIEVFSFKIGSYEDISSLINNLDTGCTRIKSIIGASNYFIKKIVKIVKIVKINKFSLQLTLILIAE